MPYNDEEGHVSTAPRKSPGQPILEFVERLRPSDRNLRVAAQASQRQTRTQSKLRSSATIPTRGELVRDYEAVAKRT